MGNCIGNQPPQQVHRPSQRWNPQPRNPQQWSSPQPYPQQMNQQPRKLSQKKIYAPPSSSLPPLDQLQSSLQDAYDPNKNKNKKPYINKEVNVNQMVLFQKYQGQCNQNFSNHIFLKVPTNKQETAFQTVKQPLWIFPPIIGNLSVQQMQNGYFQQKMTWLRFQVQKMRVSWQHGCEVIQVDRHNILMSSTQQLDLMNLKKEVKIKFDNEEVDDAGGVLRQWMNLACKQIFNFQEAGLFKLCNADETAYRLLIDLEQTQEEREFKMIIARLLGMIIGKALFERISLNCYLTKSLWRQICGKKVRQGDFFFYDRDIYKNLTFVKQNKCGTDIGLNFSYLVSSDSKKQTLVKLKQNGDTIPVTDANKKQFISLLIEYFCKKTCEHYIKGIKEGINRVLPVTYLEVFQPYQMEMLLNGPQEINVQEWKSSTLYKNCKPGDKQVEWFWKYVETLDAHKLGNLLHYVTGSRRVPILGFFFLESNRNQIRKFTIEKVEYQKANPYPKGHTCFNRLELPQYTTEKQLKIRMDVIVKDQINSFGLS